MNRKIQRSAFITIPFKSLESVSFFFFGVGEIIEIQKMLQIDQM